MNGVRVQISEDGKVFMTEYQETLTGPMHLLPIALSTLNGKKIADHIPYGDSKFSVVVAEHSYSAGKVSQVLEYSAGTTQPWNAGILARKNSFLSIHVVYVIGEKLKLKDLEADEIGILKKKISFRKGGQLWFSSNMERVQIVLEPEKTFTLPLLEEIVPQTSAREIFLSENLYEPDDLIQARNIFMERYPNNNLNHSKEEGNDD